MSLTIHAIFNAHLDPVWMWPWTAGLDEAIATCRSACDRLDAHPDLYFTQGEAWTFAMVERADPALFARIRNLVAAGRWEVVNGWWTQPDCNVPTADGLHHQISTGQGYVKDRFGLTPRCGFNPDSFGHCAAIPEILRAHGQDRYVFMRPGPHEMQLPARLFTWRSRPGGPAVTVFRIAGSYGNWPGGDDGMGCVEAATRDLPANTRHTMVFFGLGDHGGGPTERIIRWIEAHRDGLPGARMEFSTVTRFFDAVAADGTQLPEVVGELQYHAVGCYTAVRSVKAASRRAEHALARAQSVATPADQPALDRAWQAVCSHQFHDTFGGTGGPDVYPAVFDQLGGAAADAEQTLVYAVRRQMHELPDDPLPRIVLANPGPDDFSGWCEATGYYENRWRQPWRILAPDGSEVEYQLVHPGVGVGTDWIWGLRRVLVNGSIPAGGLLPLRLDVSQPPAQIKSRVSAEPTRLANSMGAAVELGTFVATPSGVPDAPTGTLPTHAFATLSLAGQVVTNVALHLIADPTDTWSHGIDRYPDGPAVSPTWSAPVVMHRGPLMAALLQEGVVGDSRLRAEWRVYADERAVDLLLEVHWRERMKLLKLVLPLHGEPTRTDGTPGMELIRPNDGRELPLHDYSSFAKMAVVCPDVFALDATGERARLTLLRAPLMAHHDPCPDFYPFGMVADQGVHLFRFRFRLAATDPVALAAEARRWQRPPLVAELTRGMPARMMEM
jgi:alpha-mannosidase